MMANRFDVLMCLGCLASLSLSVAKTKADGPADNRPESVRQIPPPGVEISAEDRTRLQAELGELQIQVETLRTSDDEFVQSLLPDVEIFARAVDQALRFNEMFSEDDIGRAGMLLEEGSRRAGQLAERKAPWAQQKGLVVRGFRSKLDDTVQPYGLLIPESYTTETPARYRCDVWLHGRGERSVELQFIHTRMTNRGAIEPEDTIVLHPFGRYSNAFKFAGEVDVLEALEHAKSQYRIDDERIGMRGFSMGGAGCWQLAVHYADRWFAANPGAGFSETPQFLLSFQGELLSAPWWEETLWQWYDCPAWVTNLANCPTIAYSGEIDVQKQAADVMVDAFRKMGAEHARYQMSPAPEHPFNRRGRELVHLIGPQTAHSIHPEAKTRMESMLQHIARVESAGTPEAVSFVTPTLRYDRMHWIKSIPSKSTGAQAMCLPDYCLPTRSSSR
ncbi:MAG: prolyl oligopeptidase family serine peptidase [Planctomycetaceae bacterium]|nr:prolyl oligopeptidase family serine peptidase [Planctomycetaceae bacterium]